MAEKTKAATPKQLKDARDKGQVVQSQDLSKLLVLMAVSEVTLGLAQQSVIRLEHLIATALTATKLSFYAAVSEVAGEAVSVLLVFILSSVGVAVLLRVVSSWMQIGFLFAPKALAFDLEKANPFSHAKQMFSGQNLITLPLSVFKAGAIVVTLYLLIKPELGTLIALAASDLDRYWLALLEVFRSVLRVTLGWLLIFAGLDFGLQKYFHAKRLRMSPEDIKKEHKQSEGDPHVKGHRRQLAKEFLNQAPIAPPKPLEDADLLVVNPTHYAVALYYRPGETPLPRIHCKGTDDAALELISRARAARIPVVQSVWLARTLAKVDEGRYIPRPTLTAVAQIYQLVRQLHEVTDEVIQVED